jgi:hypothetical protein
MKPKTGQRLKGGFDTLVISMLNVGMERGVVDFQTVFILWLIGFTLCYFVFCIIAEAHGILEEAKKTLPQ